MKMFHVFDLNHSETFSTKTILNFWLDVVVGRKLVAQDMANKKSFCVKNVLKLGFI